MDVVGGFGVAAAVIGGVVLIVIIVVGFGGQGATLRDRILNSPALSPLLIIHYFLPYGLMTFVLFMDIMSQLPQGIFGLAMAFFAMLVNFILGKFGNIAPSSGLPVNDLCEIPGLKGLSSSFIPQNLLFVTTLVTYLASFVTFSNPGIATADKTISVASATMSPSPSTRVSASWGLAMSVIILQYVGVITTPGCMFEPILGQSWARPALAVVLGMAIGIGSGKGFSSLSITQPAYSMPTTAQLVNPKPVTTGGTQSTGPGFIREQFQLGAGLGELPSSSGVSGDEIPVDIAKTSGAVTPGESSDQFVCEAYKNGQLVTSTLVG